MSESSELSDMDAQRRFLTAGTEFFAWNSGKNTPNILIQMEQRLGVWRPESGRPPRPSLH